MAPTRTTNPSPLFADQPRNNDSDSVGCQVRAADSPQGLSSSILLIEQPTELSAGLQLAIARTTGWQILVAQSAHEGLALASRLRSTLKILLITVGRNYEPSLALIRKLDELFVSEHIERPRIVVLFLAPQSPNLAVSFEKHGMECLLRSYTEQIVESVRKAQWLIRT